MDADKPAAPDNDYRTFDVTFRDTETVDSDTWLFDRTTAQPDITAYELLQILSIVIELDDRFIGRIKADDRLMRHFVRRSKATRL